MVRDIRLGELEVGTVVEPSVVVRNVGRRPLVIDEMLTGCGCLGAFVSRAPGHRDKVERLEVAPRQEVALTLRLGITGTPGVPQVRNVRFRTNDPANPSVEIAIHVTPTSRYFATPAEVALGPIPTGHSVEREIDVRALDRSVPAVSRVTSSSYRVHAEYHPGKRPSDGQPEPVGSVSVGLLRITVPACESQEDVRASVSIFCEGRENPVLTVPVTGRVVPLVELSPADVRLPRASGSGPVYAATCVCSSPALKPLTLAVTEAPADIEIRVEGIPDNPSTQFIQIDASRLRDGIPASGLLRKVGLRADVEGRSFPLTVTLTLRQP
jgi:hypothetical protein